MEKPKFKFLIEDGLGSEYLPSRGTELATGWDVRSAEEVVLKAGEYKLIPLGFRVYAPRGWWLEVRARSSTFAKKKLHSLYGVVDEDYEGRVMFACQYNPGDGSELRIGKGESIGQIVPVKRVEMEVEEVSKEEYEELCRERGGVRGDGGFGSTGK